jgi:hypothetical protein
MAQIVTTVILDDLDGSADARPVHFGLDNISYEIDLSDTNLQGFDEALHPWVQHARRVPTSGRTVRTSTPGASQDLDLADVRRWAHESGYEISTRGRVPAAILEAYRAAP